MTQDSDSDAKELTHDSDWTWGDVEMIIDDLKRDGYQPSEFKTNTSEARPEKAFLLRVERVAADD